MPDTSAEILILDHPASQPDSEVEAALDLQIKSLWSSHQSAKVTVSRTKEELKSLRFELGRKLSEKKAVLVRTGRGGGWTAYLRSHSLPRATADRYVSAYEVSLIPPDNRISESILSPPQDDIRRLVRSLLPRLRRVLTTPESISVFMQEIGQQLPTIDRSQTDNTLESPSPVGVGHDGPGLNADNAA